MHEFEEIAVPDKCRGCGVQCELGSKLMTLLLVKEAAGRVGESLVGETGQEFDSLVDSTAPQELAETIKHGFRQFVGSNLNDIDTQITSTREEIAANEMACSGVLKMRAPKGDVLYTANVCTSKRAYTRDSVLPEHLPTHIRAQSLPGQN